MLPDRKCHTMPKRPPSVLEHARPKAAPCDLRRRRQPGKSDPGRYSWSFGPRLHNSTVLHRQFGPACLWCAIGTPEIRMNHRPPLLNAPPCVKGLRLAVIIAPSVQGNEQWYRPGLMRVVDQAVLLSVVCRALVSDLLDFGRPGRRRGFYRLLRERLLAGGIHGDSRPGLRSLS